MSFSSRVVNGALRYRAAKALESLVNESNAQTASSVASRLRQNPCYLSLPAIALPAQLDLAAITYLRENSLSSPKAIEDRSELLYNFLWSRPLLSESQIIRHQIESKNLSIGEISDSDTNVATAVLSHHPDDLTRSRRSSVRKSHEIALEEWTSLTYSGHNCELYLAARLAPNFASACRVFYEIRKRCPKFIPRNLFDFGSGLGTITWATNTVWPVGCIKEHYMVEPSADMTTLSEFMFRKSLVTKSPETVFPGVYHRRFMPANKQTYDLVVSAYTLIELPGRRERLRIVSSLWDRAAGFLVLVEQGTKAGFAAILEARDWLCPHKLNCGKKDSLCNIAVQYYHFGLTREKSVPLTEKISYLIVSRGDWRRYQTPVVEVDPPYLPRLVSYGISGSRPILHDVCLPNGSVERTVFPKTSTDKPLYYFVRHAKAGDILPGDEASATNETTYLLNDAENNAPMDD
ncbi:hypothetical protein EG68_11609 [Paragonimus skrjabini miyazakii]|uniref:Methyltransferase-like protein 17, mitochondrial n=1 Tax=Paragonimus skrjabini miyazakii TaxID=59628 RepID=A0A8S9YKV6_9TREM|nr:hypothetical protein EG68_11609 [Paragonimus skrjabini miyazakii]